MHLSRLLGLRCIHCHVTTFLTIFILGLLRLPVHAQIPLIDPTFQANLPEEGEVNGIILQADGSMVIGGTFDSVSGEPVRNLARLFSNGQLDNSFGIGTDNNVLDLAEQADGKIVVSGLFTHLQGVSCFGLGRLLTNGEVDTNFDAGSLFSTGNNGTPFRLAIRPDGRILVGTLSGRLFQLTTNGGLDAAFIQTNLFQGFWIHSLFIQTNGTVLVGGGFTHVNDFASPGLVLLDASGQLNTNFQTGLADNSDVFVILQQTNGGFLVGGAFHHTNETPDTVLQRLDSNLQWDTSFQTSPFLPYDFEAYIRSAILQPDGKIVAGGDFDTVGGYHRRHIVRLDSTGHIDPCFDPGIGLGGSWGVDVVKYLPDGRILVGGTFGAPNFVPYNIARLLPQSDCDATRVYFGPEGDGFFAAATCPPGGTNYLQSSTNLIDWVDLVTETGPYIYTGVDITTAAATFFRIKKTP